MVRKGLSEGILVESQIVRNREPCANLRDHSRHRKGSEFRGPEAGRSPACSRGRPRR